MRIKLKKGTDESDEESDEEWLDLEDAEKLLK